MSRCCDLRDRGIRLSIDDFGTGYSSLGYLQQLPVDMLKIDCSFIANINQSSQQYGIVETIIRLAAHLNIQVIAGDIVKSGVWQKSSGVLLLG